MPARVLVVDDDSGIRESVRMALEKAGYRTLEAPDAQTARELLRQHHVDVMISDIYMPGEDGVALLQSVAGRSDAPRVILITARGTLESAALTQRIGAFDYLAKPFELPELIARVGAAIEHTPDAAPIEPPPDSRMIGSHPSMVEMYKAIVRVAPLAVPVLILGESGSGKELVAQSIHDLSDRAAGPFVPINCGAIPDTLLEAELFGSTRGAYTDARQDRRGALSRADGGTLFLDEIGDISPAFQVKLLRFLQDGTVTPLGSEKSHKVSVRLLAATHRDLKQLVRSGQFREDLYYRLAGYEVRVPALRDRRSDLPFLVEHFRRKVAEEMHRDAIAGPSQSVLEALSTHHWPGNVRELEQVIRRTIIDCGSLTDPNAISRAMRAINPEVPPAAEPEPANDLVPLEEAERKHIIAVLQATGGNQTQAAFILGIERKTLARKIQRFGISVA